MDVTWAVAGALLGVLLGPALRGVVVRHAVPPGEPLRSACPGCQQRLLTWRAVGAFSARCPSCRAPLTTPLVLELATAAVLALVLGRFAGQWDAAAYAFLGVLGVALAAIDARVQRLPDRLTLPAYPAAIALFTVAAVVDADMAALGRALLGGFALAASFYLLACLRPGDLGIGDVKLAGLLGLAFGWLSWPVLVLGTAAGFVLFGLTSIGLLIARRVTLSSQLAFGPFLLAGALVSVVTL